MIEEEEKKYIVEAIRKKDKWQKEHIVYQWFLTSNENGSVKRKIIFDLINFKVKYVEVSKKIMFAGASLKEVKYLDIDEFLPEEMLGKPFVLKRRSIENNIFIDKFIRSNGITDYMIEIENNNIDIFKMDIFENIYEVTDDFRYYNQNMCTEFTRNDLNVLLMMLNMYIM